MTATYVPAKEISVEVRKRLKEAFPGVKFSVRTDHHTAVRINWTDGPTEKAVNALVGDLVGGHFDGMTDMYEYNGNGSGAKYIFTNRDISAEWKTEILGEFTRITGVEIDPAANDWAMWDTMVPLNVDRIDGELHHMAPGYDKRVSEVFHQYTVTRERGQA